ncbi:hypothetical protein GGI12_003162 [Dipsacomyces acuminosporus]|nr:hypothetical protein GGI12_003162 [Dipsacomyces acuminosporus]
MGILQKDKRGTKGTKPPIPVPANWKQRIEADQAGLEGDEDSQKEKEIMAKLQEEIGRLAKDTETTWLAQSKRLKVVEKQIAGLQMLAGVSSRTLTYLRSVLIPVAIECFFLPSDVITRRQAIPIIKLLSVLDPSAVDAVFQANLLAFIGAGAKYEAFDTWSVADKAVASEVYAKQTAGHRAQALQTLANVPLGFPVVARFIGDVLDFVADALEPALPALQDPQSELGSVELIALCGEISQIVRLAFLCISKLMSSDTADSQGRSVACNLQKVILASMRSTSMDAIGRTLARLYALCWDLISCERATLTARQVGAMTLVALIEGSGLPTASRAGNLARRALDIDVEWDSNNENDDDKEISCYLPEVETSRSREICMEDAVSMLCIARAIVSFAPYETTLCALKVSPSSKNFGSSNNVHEAVFTHIASVCGRSQLAPGVKVVVFESMAGWLQETAKLLNRCLDSSSQTPEDKEFRQTAFALGQRVLVLQRERIMGYLWSYWDDPLDAVQIKVRAIFEAFLDIGSTVNRIVLSTAQGTGMPSMVEDESDAFLNDVLDLVLTMDWSRKVKYSLLGTLCSRVDIFVLFKRQPDILSSCFSTMEQVTMAPRAASLLTAILERSESDIKAVKEGTKHDADDDVEMVETVRSKAAIDLEDSYMKLWVDPVVHALCKEDEISRRMLAQHLLPTLFRALPRVVNAILKALTKYLQTTADGSAADRQVLDASRQHALIIVLKIARSQDLISIHQLANIDAELDVSADSSEKTPLMDMLNRAVYHPDWSVRADMLGLLCEARKMSTPLHEIEFDLLFKILRVSSNAISADFRQQQHSALTLLATRLVTIASHAHRIIVTGKPPVPSQKVRHKEKAKREAAIARGLADGKTEEQVLKGLGILSPEEMVAQAKVTLERIRLAVNQWLDLAVRGCLYPGAGFAKVAMGLRWLDILTSFFTPGRPAQAPENSMIPFDVPGLSSPDFERGMAASAEAQIAHPTGSGNSVTAEEAVSVLTQVLIDDPFDANRASAFSLLTAWPLVPAGNERAEAAAKQWADGLLKRALHLVKSTRAGESESGALIIQWLFRKFVVLQDFTLEFPSVAGSSGAGAEAETKHPTNGLAFANGLLNQIRRCQVAAEHNLLDAAQRFPLHGLLTAARYVAEEIDYESAAVQEHAPEWRAWLAKLASAAMDVSSIVLSVLTSASPEGNIPSSFREMEDKIDAIIQSASETVGDGENGAGLGGEEEEEEEEGEEEDEEEYAAGTQSGLEGPVGPRQQVILSYCWRAIKEVSGLLAIVATCAPGTDQADSLKIQPLLAEETVRQIGELLRTLLTSIRHRGAFSAVYPAFTQVCGRMHRSPNPELSRRIGQWLDQCLDIVTICQVSVTRRSAGWPLCLLSILTCDKHATQSLLPRAMDRIFALAEDLQTEKPDVQKEGEGTEMAEEGDGTVDLPQVHAINMLRVLLDDRALASDIIPYIEHAYVLSLTGLRSRRWAIRNVCGLLYAALTRRVFGNNKAREETKYDGITGRELFTRFPGLHPFLTNQLEDAVDQMTEVDRYEAQASEPAESEEQHDPVGAVLTTGAKFIHPALYPCLVLLARLLPSPMDIDTSSRGSDGKEESATPTLIPAFAEPLAIPSQTRRHRSPSSAAITAAGVLAKSPHSESATSAVAPPMNLEEEPLTKVNERNSTVHVTSASTMLSMYSFTELVEMCVDSPVFKTREMAARAFAPLIPSDKAPMVAVSLLKGVKQGCTSMSANSCHGALCQVHELLRIHWRLSDNGGSEAMRREFVTLVFPALAAVWPAVIHGKSEDGEGAGEEGHEVPDIIRHKYLAIINEYVADGESWILDGVTDLALIKSTKLSLARFRVSILYGFLHPLFASTTAISHMGSAQIPGAYGTVSELTKLLLACIDDRAKTVVDRHGAVQVEAYEESRSALAGVEHEEVVYNPWTVISNILSNNEFYEAKLAVLEWLTEHINHGRVEIIERIGLLNLLSYLLIDTLPYEAKLGHGYAGVQPATDPLVRAASIRLSALLCTRLAIDVEHYPFADLLGHWDDIEFQLNAPFCPLSVATAFVEYQAALLHLIGQKVRAGSSYSADDLRKRALSWAKYLYGWTDPERAAPYRDAVSKALVAYSRIMQEDNTEHHDPATEEILHVCYWRLLQDDDEGTREFVAQSVSQRLGRELGCDQACERLVLDFESQIAGSAFPETYVRDRLGYLLSLQPGQTAKAAVLAAINPNRALFEHEKPNIYIDEPRNIQLAYHSLISIASSVEGEAMDLFVDGSLKCLDSLDTAHRALIEKSEVALANGVLLSGCLGVTSLPSLFSYLQSWILGARVALFVASKADESKGKEIVHRVIDVANAWITSKELQPVHPWIARALGGLVEMAHGVLVESKVVPMSKEKALDDLYLLTYIS